LISVYECEPQSPVPVQTDRWGLPQ